MPTGVVRPCQCAGCLAGIEHRDREYHRQMNLLLSRLDEQQRRWYLAVESQRLGHGADRLLFEITGVDEKTIRRGREELAASLAEQPTDRIRQPYGIVHGGAYSAIAETICSYATGIAAWSEGKLAMGQSNSATFLRPIADGHVTATARARHRGRTTWVWDVDLTDDDERLCALVRVTVAVREADPLSRGSGS